MLAKACHIGKIITPWLWLRGKKERKKTLQIMTRTRACALKRAHRWHSGEPYVPACWILIRTSKSLFGGFRVWRRLLLFLESSAGASPAVTSTAWGLNGECGRMSARWMPRFFFYVFNSFSCWWRISTKDEVEVGAVGQSRGGGTGKKIDIKTWREK